MTYALYQSIFSAVVSAALGILYKYDEDVYSNSPDALRE